MKSSLQTFLMGQNPFVLDRLVRSKTLYEVSQDVDVFYENKEGVFWYIDVLDDGVAITYYSKRI